MAKNGQKDNFSKKLTFWPFLASLPPGDPPSKWLTKEMGALGSLLRVPSPSPDLTPSPKSRQHILFSQGGSSGTPQCIVIILLTRFVVFKDHVIFNFLFRIRVKIAVWVDAVQTVIQFRRVHRRRLSSWFLCGRRRLW